MRKWLLLITLLLCSAPAWASIAYVSASATICSVSTASTGAACSLTGSTTAGNVVIVGLSWRTIASAIVKVVGSSSGSFFVAYAQAPYASGGCNNTAGTCSAILVCWDCAAQTSVTPLFSASTKYNVTVSEWSGVSCMGITGTNAATSATPTIGVTTGDANDYVVAVFADAGSATPTISVGTLVKAGNTSTSGVAAAMTYNTAASPGTVTNTISITSAAYTVSAVELRTTSAKTYIWPDCDSTHPCLIHHKSTQYITSSDTLTTPFYLHVNPSLASNLLKMKITHPSSITISSVADNNSGSWPSGESVTDATDGTMIDVRYICGAAAGTSAIGITMSGTIGTSTIFGLEYDEVSGIATSSCERTHSGQLSATRGSLQPGNMTVTVGDLIDTFYIDATGGQQNGYPSGWFMPDDTSALIWDDMFNNAASTQKLASSTTENPKIYGNSYATTLNDQNTFIIGEAFKASSRAGTQPSSGTSWVVRDVMYRNDNVISTYKPITAFPTNGNAFVAVSSVYQTNGSIQALKDNEGSTFESNNGGSYNSSADPQQLYVCLGSGGGVVRDRALSWTMTGTTQSPLEMYDIAGAKQSTGTGCAGTLAPHSSGTVASGTCTGSLTNQCANIVSNSSQFGTAFTFTPTLNGSAASVVIMTGAMTQGPPIAACNSGGQSPPSCNNDMGLTAATTGNILGAATATSGFIFSSIWAAGMHDASHYSNGDEYGYWYTSSTSALSMDFWLGNSFDSSGTGNTSVNFVGVEIEGQPAASSVNPPVWIIAP
jgi:hypothetical protein